MPWTIKNTMRMDFRFLKIFAIAALMLGASACSQRYELHLPLSLNREKMEFKKEGASYYVLVYTDNNWTASLSEDASWLSLSRTSGSGNAQIMVTAEANSSAEREAVLTVDDGSARKTMQITQQTGIEE